MATTETTPGSPPADDHGGISGPSPEAVARGYEEDVYDSRTVLSVPILVVLFFVLAFGTVSILFGFIAPTKPDPRANPQAAERNKRSLNERLKDNDRGLSDPKTGDGQPRLEPLRLRTKYAHSITSLELPEGNSPELHPEDIRPTKDRFPALYAAGPDRVGLDKVMGLNDDQLKSLLPAAPGAGPLIDSQHAPTPANAGRGFGESRVIAPPLPKAAEPKGGEKEPKKDEKKDQKQPEKKPEQKKDNKGPTPAPPPGPKGGKP
jgi:hypothetical protein